MILKRKREFQFLNEVDVDGAPAGDQTAEDPDYTATGDEPAGGDNPPTDDSVPESGDQPPADEGESSVPGEEDIDYTKAGADDGMEGGEGGGEGEGGGNAPPEDDQVAADDARGMEDEIFKDLTPDQIDLKHKELKNNFLELYNATSNIVDRVNKIPTSDDTIASITFVANKLADLRKMIADYMNGVYSTKSYMENSINYNRFVAALNGINQILDEINKELVQKVDNEANR